MTEALDTLEAEIAARITALDGVRFIYQDECSTPADLDAACENNMRIVRALGEIDRKLLRHIETTFPDRSVGAIWRRAYRRSIDTVDDRDRAIKSRRWKARVLDLNPEPLHNAIALSGMAPMQYEERWMLAVAIPQPPPVNLPEPPHLDGCYSHIDDVVLIDPETGAAQVLGDVGATHVAPPPGLFDRLPVMTDARAWARRIALDRLEWWHLRNERRRVLQVEPTWNGWPSAAVLLAEPAKVRWSELYAGVLEVPAEMRRAVQRAVIAQARLPRIEGQA